MDQLLPIAACQLSMAISVNEFMHVDLQQSFHDCFAQKSCSSAQRIRASSTDLSFTPRFSPVQTDHKWKPFQPLSLLGLKELSENR
jgi:hypothetical protein